jgi:putative hydrolase of the HAD superfamily
MTMRFTTSDWNAIRLVVFDVDGTLYRQGPLRRRIAYDILTYSILNRDLKVVRVLAKYRKIRERLADDEVVDFDRVLIAETAQATATSTDTVRAIVTKWMEQRPLSYLAACRYPGLPDLFAGLRRNGKAIGILSDYPSKAKLEALGLSADHIVSASDAGIGLLKPHPRGLEVLIAAAGVEPRQTILIGDRPERDGIAARHVGAWALIRSPRPIEGWQNVAAFDDVLFAPVLRR